MTVLGCLRCGTLLTFRPPEARARRYSFPHADDFAGCDIRQWYDAGRIVRAELEHYAAIIDDLDTSDD